MYISDTSLMLFSVFVFGKKDVKGDVGTKNYTTKQNKTKTIWEFLVTIAPDKHSCQSDYWYFFLSMKTYVMVLIKNIDLDKRGNQVNIFLIYPQKRGYSLEAPRWGASDVYHNMFLWRNKKNINTFGLKKVPSLELCNKSASPKCF